MAYNNRANYTLLSGLNAHPVHVSRTDEEGQVTQDRFWATVAQVADPFCVHARVDIDVLQPKFQGLHYGVETIDEMRRRKRRRTAAIKREEANAAQEERERQDQSMQQQNAVKWEQAWIDLWRQKLEEGELAVAVRESAVFQRELEYRHLERCPLYGRKGQRDNADRQQARENDGARQQARQRRRQVIFRRVTPRDVEANASVEGRNIPGSHPHAPQPP